MNYDEWIIREEHTPSHMSYTFHYESCKENTILSHTPWVRRTVVVWYSDEFNITDVKLPSSHRLNFSWRVTFYIWKWCSYSGRYLMKQGLYNGLGAGLIYIYILHLWISYGLVYSYLQWYSYAYWGSGNGVKLHVVDGGLSAAVVPTARCNICVLLWW